MTREGLDAARAESRSVDDRALMLQRCRLFAGWSHMQLAEAAAIARVQNYDRGAEIFAQNPEQRDMFVVASGRVEISRGTEQGRKFVLSLAGPNEILAVVRLLTDVPLHYVYRAYEDCVLLHLPCDRLAAILDADPILWRDVALLMCLRQGDSLRLLNDQKLGSLEQRMAATLIDLARIHGIAGDAGTDLGLRLPQEQLGAMLGVTRQSVNQQLRAFERGGLIESDYNRITIRDPLALEAIASQQRC